MELIDDLSLHPLHLFSEEIKEPSLRISSIHTVSTIAVALGPQNTRETLIPFLSALFHQEGQECQLAILQVLPSLIPHIGHSFYSYLLLEVAMDILCLYDEKEIRDAAFTTLYKVLSRIDVRRAEAMLYNTLQELASQKQFRIKELVIRTIAPIFIGLEPEYQQKFMDLFQGYSTDDREEVRVVVASQLNELIRIMPPAPETQIRTLLEAFLEDKSEKVRCHLVESVILLNQLLGEDAVKEYFQKLCEDKSSKVKCELYDKVEVLSREFSESTILPFLSQIKDFAGLEQEVKNKILSKLPVLLQVCPPSLLDYLKELLLPLSSLQLKSTLAEALCVLKDQEHLSMLIEQGDNQFKLKLVPKLPNLSRRVDLLRSLFKHKSYRIRQSLLTQIQTRISGQFQDPNKLLEIALELLTDRVAVVRSKASSLATKLITSNKMDIDKVKQMIQPYLQSESWAVRVSALCTIKSLIQGKEYLKLWEMVRLLGDDRVGGVQMMVVEIADKMKLYGMRSCGEEVEELRRVVEQYY